MPQFAWLTDIHLDFVDEAKVDNLCEEIARTRADGVFLTGDVAEAPDVVARLEHLERALPMPVYFVLGNHDYYRGSIAGVRGDVAASVAARERLVYLPLVDHVRLGTGAALVGHDGWGDARAGDWANSTVRLNDYLLIAELIGLSWTQLGERLRALGDEAAAHFARVLPPALADCEHVYVLTHAPPLKEACWHEGRTSDDNWAPHFTCAAVGETLLAVMRDHPHRRMTVLCGHTHGSGECRPLPNVEIFTGGADYGRPAIQRIFEVD